ncbi:MAG: sugar ABC transporter permease [Clostridiales bacterium]|nr:sugar ABC transporter permease [Clostridiales bacterium]
MVAQKKVRRLQFEGANNSRLALCLIAPVVIYLLLVMLTPILWAIITSMQNKNRTEFVAFENYAWIFTNRSAWRSFSNALGNTLVYTLFCVGGKVLLGVIIALVLNQQIKGRNLYRALLLLPWTIPTVTSVFTWRWLYSDVGGVLSYLLQVSGFTTERVEWLATNNTAMLSCILVNVWRGAPFIGISVLSALQTIPHSLYEAARIDGANAPRQFHSITLPYIKDVLGMSSLVTTIWTLNDFEMVWLLTRGAPAYATELLSLYSYRVGFSNGNLPRAIAVSFMFFPVVIAMVAVFTNRSLRKESDFAGG